MDCSGRRVGMCPKLSSSCLRLFVQASRQHEILRFFEEVTIDIIIMYIVVRLFGQYEEKFSNHE